MTITNDRGDYLIDKLKAGLYDVKAELPGFKTQLSLGIRLELTQVARVDFVVTPGDITEEVTVIGQSTIIDTDAVEVASVVEEKRIQDLPIQGRNLVKLAYLATGGTLPERAGAGTPAENALDSGGGYPSFNGLFNHSNQIGLPGAELQDIRRSFADQSHGWQTALGWVNPVGSNLVTEFNASLWSFLWLFARPLHQTNFAKELGYDDADRHPVFYEDGSRGPGNVPLPSPSPFPYPFHVSGLLAGQNRSDFKSGSLDRERPGPSAIFQQTDREARGLGKQEQGNGGRQRHRQRQV